MAETIEELQKLLEVEKKKVFTLEQKVRLYEQPSEMRSYYSMNRMLNMQADFLNGFNLQSEIKTFSKDDKLYDRASDLWEKLPANISKMNSLKLEIGATDDEEKDTSKRASFLDKNAR